jgi:hypothetical protein
MWYSTWQFPGLWGVVARVVIIGSVALPILLEAALVGAGAYFTAQSGARLLRLAGVIQ